MPLVQPGDRAACQAGDGLRMQAGGRALELSGQAGAGFDSSRSLSPCPFSELPTHSGGAFFGVPRMAESVTRAPCHLIPSVISELQERASSLPSDGSSGTVPALSSWGSLCGAGMGSPGSIGGGWGASQRAQHGGDLASIGSRGWGNPLRAQDGGDLGSVGGRGWGNPMRAQDGGDLGPSCGGWGFLQRAQHRDFLTAVSGGWEGPQRAQQGGAPATEGGQGSLGHLLAVLGPAAAQGHTATYPAPPTPPTVSAPTDPDCSPSASCGDLCSVTPRGPACALADLTGSPHDLPAYPGSAQSHSVATSSGTCELPRSSRSLEAATTQLAALRAVIGK